MSTEPPGITNEPEVRLALNGKKVLTLSETSRFREHYNRASLRSRKAIVASYLLQGATVSRLSALLGVSPAEVQRNYENACEEMVQEWESVPEGPMLMAQIVAEGYSRLIVTSLSTISEMLDEVKSSDKSKVDHSTIQSYIKLRFEVVNQLTDRLEKYGLLPSLPKLTGSHGGARSGAQGSEITDIGALLAQIASESGVDLEGEKAKMIEAAVRG